ncbi:MAG: hypothetical protein J6J43_01010 [Oscillospiraceae bacterium]|nr:hypothetical protein [Oscillospiraceae bacterium]
MLEGLLPLFFLPFALIWLIVCLKDNMPYGFIKHHFQVCLSIFIIILAVAVSHIGIYVYGRDQANNNLPPSTASVDRALSDHNNTSDYSKGYNAALHGTRPNPEDVCCYNCGYSGSECPDCIHFFQVATFWLPVCDDCIVSAAPDSPITFLGEGYTFVEATSD